MTVTVTGCLCDCACDCRQFEEFRAGSSTQHHKPVLEKKRLGLDPAEWRHFQLTMPQDDIGIDSDVCHIIAASHYVKVRVRVRVAAVSEWPAAQFRPHWSVQRRASALGGHHGCQAEGSTASATSSERLLRLSTARPLNKMQMVINSDAIRQT